ncbi:MAG: hypothetical protein V3V95_01480, partial [Thermodesulfobacteriota bacterium]
EEKPTLILNGDILELALCFTNEASMAFDRFIESVMPAGGELFDRIIYIPGNHDHHLWELARETQYVNFIKNKQPTEKLEVPWHATNMFIEKYLVSVKDEDKDKATKSFFLRNLVRRFDHLNDEKGGKTPDIIIAYPNFGLYKEGLSKNVIFNHGHYIEPLYHLMSTMRTALFPGRDLPNDIRELEGENFAWIDFFWSAMGRSGGAGQDIELIYEKMQEKDGIKELLHNLSRFAAENVGYEWSDSLETKAFERVLNSIAGKAGVFEKKITDKPLSKKSKQGLADYMEGPLKSQLLTERHIPKEVTFVFGHTHKPFASFMNFSGYMQPVNIYNTGGWVVESRKREKLHGGSIVLVDEALDTVSLRMYNESDDGFKCVKVEEVSQGEVAQKTFYKKIKDIVDFDTEGVWKNFSNTVKEEVTIRAVKLGERIDTPG